MQWIQYLPCPASQPSLSSSAGKWDWPLGEWMERVNWCWVCMVVQETVNCQFCYQRVLWARAGEEFALGSLGELIFSSPWPSNTIHWTENGARVEAVDLISCYFFFFKSCSSMGVSHWSRGMCARLWLVPGISGSQLLCLLYSFTSGPWSHMFQMSDSSCERRLSSINPSFRVDLLCWIP